jgi:phosphatidylglycerophosphate synthase
VTTFSESLQALASAQKTPRGSPAYSRWVNRPFGRVLAAAAVTTGRSPDQVTLAGAACTTTAIALIAGASSSPLVAASVTVLLVFGYALDAADGQLARLQGTASAAGEWLDHVLDAAKIPALHLAVAVHWYRDEEDRGVVLVVPLICAVVASVLFAAHVLDGRVKRPSLAALSGARPSVTRSLLVAPTDYGVLCGSFGLWWLPRVFTTLYVALAAATLVFAAVALPVWYVQLRGSVATRSPR